MHTYCIDTDTHTNMNIIQHKTSRQFKYSTTFLKNLLLKNSFCLKSRDFTLFLNFVRNISFFMPKKTWLNDVSPLTQWTSYECSCFILYATHYIVETRI